MYSRAGLCNTVYSNFVYYREPRCLLMFIEVAEKCNVITASKIVLNLNRIPLIFALKWITVVYFHTTALAIKHF